MMSYNRRMPQQSEGGNLALGGHVYDGQFMRHLTPPQLEDATGRLTVARSAETGEQAVVDYRYSPLEEVQRAY
jgi:hypothetical protein